MIKVAVCDDENQIINLIEKLLLKESKMHHIPLDIDAFYSGETLEKDRYICLLISTCIQRRVIK